MSSAGSPLEQLVICLATEHQSILDQLAPSSRYLCTTALHEITNDVLIKRITWFKEVEEHKKGI